MNAKTAGTQRNPRARAFRRTIVLGLVVVAVLAVPFVRTHDFRGATSLVAATAAAPAAAMTAAPTTAAGYQAMFDQLDVDEWGAGDVGISVPLTATRTVWLFGDTFSESHGIVNSTAITQDGGRLHVSQYGNQLLPQADVDARGRKVVYWIEAARKISDTHVEVTVAPTWVSNTGSAGAAWGRTTSQDRTGVLVIDVDGDVTFDRWTGWTARPNLETKFLTVADGAPYQREGHLFYGKRQHPEARLASGKTLVTICQNRVAAAKRDDGGIDYAAYRMIFLEEQV